MAPKDQAPCPTRTIAQGVGTVNESNELYPGAFFAVHPQKLRPVGLQWQRDLELVIAYCRIHPMGLRFNGYAVQILGLRCCRAIVRTRDDAAIVHPLGKEFTGGLFLVD